MEQGHQLPQADVTSLQLPQADLTSLQLPQADLSYLVFLTAINLHSPGFQYMPWLVTCPAPSQSGVQGGWNMLIGQVEVMWPSPLGNLWAVQHVSGKETVWCPKSRGEGTTEGSAVMCFWDVPAYILLTYPVSPIYKMLCDGSLPFPSSISPTHTN